MVTAIAEGQRPKPLQGGIAVKRAEKRPGHRVVGIDLAKKIAEVADQQVAAERAEIGWSQGDAPWGSKAAAGGGNADESVTKVPSGLNSATAP